MEEYRQEIRYTYSDYLSWPEDERWELIVGVPHMMAEILSPSTAARDTLYKFNCCLEAGVREHWIVDPDRRTVSTYILTGGQYIAKVYGDSGHAPVSILPGCEIDLEELFKHNATEENP